MTMVSSGPISLAGTATTGGLNQSIQVELGGTGSSTISLNDSNVRTLLGVPSGAISLSNAYGKSNAFTFNATISANTQNYNLRAAAVAAGWNQIIALKATITINSGISVGSSSTGSYAFDTGVTFPSGTTLSLINNGYIVGAGANGGNGAINTSTPGSPGSSGGPALRAQAAISIQNNGTIGGGGGGGGGGGSAAGFCGKYLSTVGGSGGGGGAGNIVGLGGAGQTNGFNGSNGTLTTGGAGGPSRQSSNGNLGGAGGAGGSLGASGSNGGAGNFGIALSGGGAGGSGGAAVNGNANITWTATGTRLGGIS